MSGLQDAATEVAVKLEELEDSVKIVRNLKEVPDRKKQEREARKIMNQVKTAANALRREVNQEENPAQKSVYLRKHTEALEKVAQYDKELKNLTRPVRKQVMSAEDRAMNNIMGDQDMSSAGKVMQVANRAQDDNLNILRNIEREMNVTEETGNEIALRLQADTEKIREIDRELNTLQANIDQAKKQVMWFARQMASDKCFLCIMVLVILALVGLTFWKIYKGRQEGDSAPEPTPPPTDRVQPPPEPTTLAPVGTLAPVLTEPTPVPDTPPPETPPPETPPPEAPAGENLKSHVQGLAVSALYHWIQYATS
jgi:cation transport regulator ChaC